MDNGTGMWNIYMSQTFKKLRQVGRQQFFKESVAEIEAYLMTYMNCRLGEIRVWRKVEVNVDVLVSLQNTKDGVRQPSILVPREPAASRHTLTASRGCAFRL